MLSTFGGVVAPVRNKRDKRGIFDLIYLLDLACLVNISKRDKRGILGLAYLLDLIWF